MTESDELTVMIGELQSTKYIDEDAIPSLTAISKSEKTPTDSSES